MISEALNNLIDVIKTVSDFPLGSVLRGEPGKINQVKSVGCLVMGDFETPSEFSGEPGETTKLLPVVATCFICVGQQKSLEKAEDLALSLMETVVRKVRDSEAVVGNITGGTSYKYWELAGVEWMERSASLSVLAVEFRMKFQA